MRLPAPLLQRYAWLIPIAGAILTAGCATSALLPAPDQPPTGGVRTATPEPFTINAVSASHVPAIRYGRYLRELAGYVRPRAQSSAFTEFYLKFFAHHLRAIAKPGGLFEDTTVTRLPWRGQVRRVRMVVYRRTPTAVPARRKQSPEQALTTICDRLAGGLANAGVKARRMLAAVGPSNVRCGLPMRTGEGPFSDLG